MTQGQYTYKIRKGGWLYVFFVFPFYISITALKMEFPTDLVTFTEEILNGKLHFFLCSVYPCLCPCSSLYALYLPVTPLISLHFPLMYISFTCSFLLYFLIQLYSSRRVVNVEKFSGLAFSITQIFSQ